MTYGDPGLLASRMIKKATPVHKIGVVPHYVDKNHPTVLELSRDPDFTVIDVEQDWKQMLTQISVCDLILSSSLHGMIVADSYEIPNARLSFSDAIVDGDFKFFDYGFSVGRGEIKAYPVVSIEDIYMVARKVELSGPIISSQIVDEINDRLIDGLASWSSKRRLN